MDASVASPVHTAKDAHYKDHTSALPNTGIYDINASTNKYTSGISRLYWFLVVFYFCNRITVVL